MAYGDLLPARIDGRSLCRGEVRDEWRNAIVECELALFDELHDCGAGDRLGHAGDPEQRVRLHRRLVLDVRVAKAACVKQLAVANHSNRAAWNGVLPHQIADALIVLLHSRHSSTADRTLLLRRRRNRRSDRRRSQLSAAGKQNRESRDPNRGDRHRSAGTLRTRFIGTARDEQLGKLVHTVVIDSPWSPRSEFTSLTPV